MIRPDTNPYDEVARLLDTLGGDPHQVAATLRVAEVRGVRGSAVAHPVCWWLVGLIPDLCVVLGPETVQVSIPGRGLARRGAVVPLPPAVRSFAQRFDDGQHPDLELWLGRWRPVRQVEAHPGRPGRATTGEPRAAIMAAPDPMADTIRLAPLPASGAGSVIDGELVPDRAADRVPGAPRGRSS